MRVGRWLRAAPDASVARGGEPSPPRPGGNGV